MFNKQGGEHLAASRTGTAKWKRVVKEVRQRDAHLTHCIECNTELDWEYSGRPNSAEVDHIIPHSKGGQDTADNARIICRRCNQSLGGKLGRAKAQVRPRIDLETKVEW